MWKDNLVVYKSKNYLNFCTSIGVHKNSVLVYQQISMTRSIFTFGPVQPINGIE